CRSERGEFGVSPPAKETRTFANAVGARFHDDPGGTVSKHDRIRDRRRSLGEEPQGRIPPAMEVRVRRIATDVGQLSTGTDRGARASHADRTLAQRRHRIDVAIHLPGLEDPHGTPADLAAGHELVNVWMGHGASSLSRIRSRMSAAVRGSTISGSPDSDEHSMPISPSYPIPASAEKIDEKSM